MSMGDTQKWYVQVPMFYHVIAPIVWQEKQVSVFYQAPAHVPSKVKDF